VYVDGYGTKYYNANCQSYNSNTANKTNEFSSWHNSITSHSHLGIIGRLKRLLAQTGHVRLARTVLSVLGKITIQCIITVL
jgi:hypothetical protein